MEKKSKPTKKIILIVLLVLVLAAVGFGVWKVMQPKVTAVTTAAVERRDIAQTIVISGRLEANDTFETVLSLSQKVQTIVKKEGDQVKAGDKIRFRFVMDWKNNASEIESIEKLPPDTALDYGAR